MIEVTSQKAFQYLLTQELATNQKESIFKVEKEDISEKGFIGLCKGYKLTFSKSWSDFDAISETKSTAYTGTLQQHAISLTYSHDPLSKFALIKLEML